MGIFADGIGIPLIGSWIGGLLFVFEAHEMAIYFSRYRNDSSLMKIWVIAVLTVDSVFIVGLYTWVYMNTEARFTDFNSTSNSVQIVHTVTSIITTVTMLLVQTFLIHRCWLLCRRWYIVIPLIFLSWLGFGAALVGAVDVTIGRDTELPANIAVVSSAATDVFIAATLIITLKPMVRNSFRKTTKQKIKRILVQSVSTGSLTTGLHITIVVLHITNATSEIPHSLGFCLGRIYAISMMLNLNNRRWENSDQNTTAQDSTEQYYLTTVNTSLTPQGTSTNSRQITGQDSCSDISAAQRSQLSLARIA
ncbi:hypothetical protein VKT23_006123 [Stygiomarasmius scandens]|uniref:DUF6534 domain-containing protein n=1 Tax=Marasmiellus scandens TaxID=2682957 RepID=A0ABR1JRD2_9AGAR